MRTLRTPGLPQPLARLTRRTGLAPLARLALAPLLLTAALAGCLDDDSTGSGVDPKVLSAVDACRQGPITSTTLFFGPRHTLQRTLPEAGSEPGNAFSSGFLTNDLKEWLGEPAAEGQWLTGEVTVEYWVRNTGSPAPLAVDPTKPGEGYHFFAQFGSDRSLQPAYATQFDTVAPLPDTVEHYIATFTLAEGGFVVEKGDRVRFLLTDLALDGPDGSGHDVLFGGDTPSQVRFSARCYPTLAWTSMTVVDETINLPGNQGLLTGGIRPTEGFNFQIVAFTFPPGTQRMTVTLTQQDDLNQVKDDIDLVLYEHAGAHEYGIGSPYSDEAGTLWQDNLASHFPYGEIDLQVNSYSGVDYTGRLLVTVETARLA